MDTIKLYYGREPNLGDFLTISIIERLFHKRIDFTRRDRCRMIGIGSMLQSFVCSESTRTAGYFMGKYFTPVLHVWGSGFIKPKVHEREVFARRMKFHALRGKISLERVRDMQRGIRGEEIVLGDPGLLASLLIDGGRKIKYRLGIIPHFADQNDALVDDVKNRIKGATVIDVAGDPIETIKRIGECGAIISSAMHGLIVADSLGVPNRRIILSDNITGGDYKFRDYYSVYDIDIPEAIDLRKCRFTEDDLLRIESSYKIKQDDVNRIKNRLFEAFPLK